MREASWNASPVGPPPTAKRRDALIAGSSAAASSSTISSVPCEATRSRPSRVATTARVCRLGAERGATANGEPGAAIEAIFAIGPPSVDSTCSTSGRPLAAVNTATEATVASSSTGTPP